MWDLILPQEDRDDPELLDLSIINVRIPQVAIEPAALSGEYGVGNGGEHANWKEELQEDNGIDNHNEQVEGLQEDGPPALVNHDIVYANLEQEDSRQDTFLRIVRTPPSFKLTIINGHLGYG